MPAGLAADYVIAGGGSAGAVLAARLSEDADASVILIEAGGSDWHPFFHIPAGFAKMTKGIASWGWSTVPQKHMQNRVFWYTQAKVLGGGSSINAQLYNRGNKQDFDGWNMPGWDYASVLSYFKRSEGNARLGEPYHGTSGPLGVGDPLAPLPICEAFIAAAASQGMARNEDFNGERQAGAGYYQLTQKHSRRSSTATAFLKPARGRKNLQVITGTLATRVIVEKGRATGLEVIRKGRREIITAAREVIVASGAIGSPKLLLQSGLGPADELKALGISVHADLPVGRNLQDHVDLFAIAECKGPFSYDGYAKPLKAALAGLQYALTRRGPAASSLFETGGFGFANKAEACPDIQFHFGLGSGIEAGVLRLTNDGVTLNSAYLRPKSRGSVRLASADPLAAPLIDPNYWAEPDDRRASLEGLRMAREILRQPEMREFLIDERLPGPDVTDEQALIDYACRNAKTDHHPCGTCAMGLVTEPDLKVKGIAGLRVADSSVMPKIVSANTNAATIMVAEKASDMIRNRQ